MFALDVTTLLSVHRICLHKMNIIIFSVVILIFNITVVQLRTVDRKEIEENEILPNSDSEDCTCEYYCPKGLASFNTGCFSNQTVYFECQPSSCITKSCPPNQVFNLKSKTCEYCNEGYRMDKTRSSCTCNEGTTFDRIFSKCVPCPAGSEFTDDYCHCPEDEIHDDVAHVCRKCPDDATKYQKSCLCKNKTMFFSNMDFSCKECPGVVIDNDFEGEWQKSFCHCQGDNEAFSMWSATCVPCPPNSVSQISQGKFQYCSCKGETKYYDDITNTCAEY